MEPAGALHWLEMNTRHSQIAQEFYLKLFGWHFEIIHSNHFGMMPILKLDSNSREFANIFMALGAFAPSHWQVFLNGDVDKIGKEVEKHGGTADQEPSIIQGWSKMLGIKDPVGTSTTIISFDEIREHTEPRPGEPYMVELFVPDAHKVVDFYSNLFSADVEELEKRWLLRKSGRLLFSICDSPYYDFSQRWVPYFRSNAAGADQQRAQLLGAVVQVPKTKIEGLGDLAIIGDPIGAHFGFINPNTK